MNKKSLGVLSATFLLLLTGCGKTGQSSTTPISSTPTSSSVVSSTNTPTSSSTSTTTITGVIREGNLKEAFNCITVAEALKIAEANTTATTERYFIYGKVTEITNYNYGQMTISDGTGSIVVYGSYDFDGVKRFSELDIKPEVGDEIVLYSTLQNFNGSMEVKSGWIVGLIHESKPFDEKDYTSMTIAEARNAAKGSKVIVEGVVARITYSMGMNPNGFYVVDSTSSIYVYDSKVANDVSIGNKIRIAGNRDSWILDKEMDSAEKFGYKGSTQLSEAKILSNDKGTSDFDKSWITEKTVKEIVNTPVTTDISNIIYKTTAYIKKNQGASFVNYYINDLDGVTGSYAYTQCSGSDFSWLDEFDQKICTVYMTAINAKSTSTGCFWRFVPISVSYDNFTFDEANIPEFVYEYHVKDLLKNSYTGDPILELPISVSSDILNFENATVTYTSSNTDSIYFATEGGKYVMHAKNNGTAEVTIKVEYATNSFSKTLTINVTKPVDINALTVKEAIESTVDELITVKGVAGPSLVNKEGFYLIDDTGAIPVILPSDALSEIEYGNELIIKGKRDQYGADAEKGIVGTISLTSCEIVANLYGKHDYSTASFDSTKTIADLSNILVTKNATDKVYVVKASIKKTPGPRSSTVKIYVGETSIMCYTNSGNEYDWAQAYFDQEVTLEIALCNWNKKDFYKCNILSLTDSTGNKIVNLGKYTTK